MDRLVAIEAFARVAEAGGFAAAARSWGRSKAAVSKYISWYEAELGVQLFRRTTRSVSLTDSGRAHYPRALQVLAIVEESEAKLRDEHVSLRGVLRISAPPGLLSLDGHAVLARFLDRHPNVEFDLDITHRLVDLVEERIDVAIRVTKPDDSSLVARKLAPVEAILVASPDYFEAMGRPASPEALTGHRCILDRNQRSPVWTFRVGGRRLEVPVSGRVRVNDTFTARDLAVEGVGITLIPNVLVRPHLETNRLEEVLAGQVDLTRHVYAVTSQRRLLSGRARVFIQHLKDTLPAVLRGG